MTCGYAVKDETGVLIATVSPTKIGAMVNWLVFVPRVFAMRDWPDSYVLLQFDRLKTRYHAALVKVEVTEAVDIAP
jgi:hypothetical protein